ncbi:unnamed protein product [Urochloa humidicola]
MSKYGAIPAAASSTPPAAPPEASSTAPNPITTSCATCPGRASLLPFRPWRELLDPRALSAPPRGLAAARRRARANLAYFAANYQLAFLAVVSVSLLWRCRWWSVCLPTVLLCLLFISGKSFPVIMALMLLQLWVTGAATSVFVSVPVGLLLVVAHAVLHSPEVDSADDEETGSVVYWRRGMHGPRVTCKTRPPQSMK